MWRDRLAVHSGGRHITNLGRRDLVEESLDNLVQGYTGNLMIGPCREIQAKEVMRFPSPIETDDAQSHKSDSEKRHATIQASRLSKKAV